MELKTQEDIQMRTYTQTLDNQRQQTLNRDPDPDRFTQIGRGPKLKNLRNSTVKYGECLKNHAASVGGKVFDGCGEFMPSGEEGTLEALKCAACECHRNFHRKEVNGEYSPTPILRRNLLLSPLQLPHHHQQNYSNIGFHVHPNTPAIVQPMNVAFGGGNESSSEELNEIKTVPSPPFGKRHRTKFSQEQKEKMLDFAEKLGWKIQKQECETVDRFCSQVGVKRQVFKVWMHNNKNNNSNCKEKNEDLVNQPLEMVKQGDI